MAQILGFKLPTHKKGKYLPNDVCRIKGLISTINKARDLIRSLLLNELNSSDEVQETTDYLRVLFDRMLRMGLYTIPSMEKRDLEQWSQVTADHELECLKRYIEKRKANMVSQEREASRKLFLNPRKRKIWFQNAFGIQNSGCPNI